ncbi:MAG: hypothetical protein LBE17_09565 [Treponema sp.]|nr:hypothetical protein [Treponema sp.]
MPSPFTTPAVLRDPGGSGGLFPSIYFLEYLRKTQELEAASPYWVPVQSEMAQEVPPTAVKDGPHSMLLNDDILAFYGHPLSQKMGILGRYSIEELDVKLSALAEEYRAVSGGRGIRKAFYIIYGTVWPKGEIGIIQEEVLQRYIQYAQEKDILIIIDHQIGRYKPEDAMRKLLPYLRYPNVHLALDPEWRTNKPMREIGTVTADEVNTVQRIMSDYLREQNIQGERLLVIHQFNWRMIQEREKVTANYEGVQLVHCADGFGTPAIKRESYAYNAKAGNLPVKGFKLFYNFNIPGAGYDSPLMSPADVFNLNPRPYVIIYQ